MSAIRAAPGFGNNPLVAGRSASRSGTADPAGRPFHNGPCRAVASRIPGNCAPVSWRHAGCSRRAGACASGYRRLRTLPTRRHCGLFLSGWRAGLPPAVRLPAGLRASRRVARPARLPICRGARSGAAAGHPLPATRPLATRIALRRGAQRAAVPRSCQACRGCEMRGTLMQVKNEWGGRPTRCMNSSQTACHRRCPRM